MTLIPDFAEVHVAANIDYFMRERIILFLVQGEGVGRREMHTNVKNRGNVFALKVFLIFLDFFCLHSGFPSKL